MRKNPHPRLFNEVLEAIANLKDKKGSSTKTIMDQVESILSMKRKQLRNDHKQFFKALKHGLDTGLITKISGKYKLGLKKKDYEVYRNFQRILVCDDHFRENKRSGRRGRRRKSRRRGRRRRYAASDATSGTDDYNSDCSSITSSPRVSNIPEDRGRRRGRKRRGRRRRSGGKRAQTIADFKLKKGRAAQKIMCADEEKSSNGSMESTDTRKSTAENKKETDRSDRNDRDDRNGRDDRNDRNEEARNQDYEPKRENGDESADASSKHCENPECLCNMGKSEDGSRSQQ